MRRRRSNLMALAVLALLYERPMHPYEMATTMRERHKEDSIKINYGTLYSVVQALQKYGLIAVAQVEREGRRPERTVYELTEAGQHELFGWMEELLTVPTGEPSPFESALSLLMVLPPEEAVRLLRMRCERLEEELVAASALEGLAGEKKLPRIHLIEWEYRMTLRRAEFEWLNGVVREIEEGTLDGVEQWRAYVAARASGAAKGEAPGSEAARAGRGAPGAADGDSPGPGRGVG